MLKRLFVLFFILQSFASMAMANIMTSQLNKAEQTKMQMMHHMMSMEVICMQMSDFQSDMNAQDCACVDNDCTNFMCNSIHSVSNFLSVPTVNLSALTIEISTQKSASVFIPTIYFQPETPPPSV